MCPAFPCGLTVSLPLAVRSSDLNPVIAHAIRDSRLHNRLRLLTPGTRGGYASRGAIAQITRIGEDEPRIKQVVNRGRRPAIPPATTRVGKKVKRRRSNSRRRRDREISLA